MTSLVVDTHTLIWYLNGSSRISATAKHAVQDAIKSGHHVYISSITIVEITYLVEKGKLHHNQLSDLLTILHRSDSAFIVKSFFGNG